MAEVQPARTSAARRTTRVWDLLIGYNGIGRLNGNETGSVGGGVGQGGGRWGATGWNRLFLDGMGGQIAWLIPAAVVFLVAGLVWRGRAPRTDRPRAALLLWGGWLVLMGGSSASARGSSTSTTRSPSAPPIGALIGMGAAVGWRRRQDPIARAVLAAALAATASWGYVLLDRTPDWAPYLRPLVLGGGLRAASAVLALPWLSRRAATALAAGALDGRPPRPGRVLLDTARTPQRGAIVTAGPSTGFGGFGGPAAEVVAVPAVGGSPAPGPAGSGGRRRRVGGRGNGGGGMGGCSTPAHRRASCSTRCNADADRYTWVAATTGANNAAGYQLSTGHAVLAIGGFNGTDPSPTLDQFVAWVRPGGSTTTSAAAPGWVAVPAAVAGTASEIASWVSEHAAATTIGDTTVYDLSGLAS